MILGWVDGDRSGWGRDLTGLMAGESYELLTMRVGVAEVFCDSRKGADFGLGSGDDWRSELDFGAFGTITTFLAICCFFSGLT